MPERKRSTVKAPMVVCGAEPPVYELVPEVVPAVRVVLP